MLGTRVMGAVGSASRLLRWSAKDARADGKEAYILQCKGGRYACAQQAGDLCGSRGYQAHDQAGRVIPPQVPLGNFAELMITCREAPAAIYGGESHPPPQSGSERLPSF